MRDETLADLYREEPEVRSRLRAASGYGVFSDIQTQLLVLSTGRGYGVVVDNRTGQQTFMRMGQVGVGLGAGVKDFRAVFIFNNPQVLRDFVDKGWQFGGEADAAAVTSDKGAQASGAGAMGEDIEVYQFTEGGVALKASVAGTRYWKDDELN